jgi:hypothetical protein
MSHTEAIPLQETTTETPTVELLKKPRPCSNLTLAPTTMEDLSRISTQAPTPTGDGPDYENPSSAHPFSAFYSHPQSQISCEQFKRSSLCLPPQCHIRNSVDLEKGLSPATATPTKEYSFRNSTSHRNSFDPSLTTTRTSNSAYNTPKKSAAYVSVWPACEEVRQRNKWARRQRDCRLFRKLTRKQKMIVKIFLAILVIGLAVAIGCAISYKTGGLVWKSATQQGTL